MSKKWPGSSIGGVVGLVSTPIQAWKPWNYCKYWISFLSYSGAPRDRTIAVWNSYNSTSQSHDECTGLQASTCVSDGLQGRVSARPCFQCTQDADPEEGYLEHLPIHTISNTSPTDVPHILYRIDIQLIAAWTPWLDENAYRSFSRGFSWVGRWSSIGLEGHFSVTIEGYGIKSGIKKHRFIQCLTGTGKGGPVHLSYYADHAH